ncbi:hypothetical protein FHR87_002694 [Azomonas macrocytogenes]|uniref:Uncharacterized protein n=1 Tax=Azomonas macrocytogenes TaxID=69962 RepID=A0A839T5G1_AZOMA|nr:hypothetical protein [Azomonas macrocytogenes]
MYAMKERNEFGRFRLHFCKPREAVGCGTQKQAQRRELRMNGARQAGLDKAGIAARRPGDT